MADIARWPTALLDLLSKEFPRPVRRAVHRRDQGCTGDHFSPLMAAVRGWESPDEASLCTLGDVSPTWWGYWCQVSSLKFEYEGRICTAYPDFLIRLGSGAFQLLEVKPASEYTKYRARYDAIAASCAARGVAYQVITDQWLHTGPKLANAAVLHPAWNTLVEDGLIKHVIAVVEREQPTTLGQLWALRSMAGIRREATFACALRGAFRIHLLDRHIGEGSRIGPAIKGHDRLLVGSKRVSVATDLATPGHSRCVTLQPATDRAWAARPCSQAW